MTRNGHKNEIVELEMGKAKGFDRITDFWFSDDIRKWQRSWRGKSNKEHSSRRKKKL